MKRIWDCRRTFLAVLGIGCLTFLGYKMNSTDVALAIASIVTAIAGSNALEAIKKPQAVKEEVPAP